jgi:branched-chain amino acid transport system substrate-binding protein
MNPQRSIWLWGSLAAVVAAASGQRVEPPGRGFSQQQVKVGLLIASSDGRTDELAARHSAELAVAQANQAGGLDGRPFELLVRSVEGPWGSGSTEIVNLVFEEDVWAILGALDGRSAHLAEQVVAKGQVVLLSPWATDLTLTQINVPWFFRCVPDDRQQATALVDEIFRVRRLRQVATVTADGYDARMAANTLVRIAETAGYPIAAQFLYRDTAHDLEAVLDHLARADIDGVVIFGPPGPTAELIRQMQSRGMRQALFGPLALADDALFASAKSALEGAVVVVPGHRRTSTGRTFRREFHQAFGYPPSAAAAYAYDGMRLIIQAIRMAGLDREEIRNALANIDYAQGVTGPIRFDANGNRLGPVDLMEIVDGRPRFLDSGRRAGQGRNDP